MAGPLQAQHISWSETKPLSDYAATDDAQDYSSELARDEAGNIVAVWLKNGGVGVSRSMDSGASWHEAFNLSGETGTILDAEIVYAGNGTFLAIWIHQLPGGDTVAHSIRSVDTGQSWSEPAMLPISKSGTRVSIASDGAGTIVAALEGIRMTSSDFGSTWTENSPENDGFWKKLLPLHSPITHTASGDFIQAFMRSEMITPCAMPGSFDCYYTYFLIASSPDGLNWTEQYLPGWQLYFSDIVASGNTVAILGSSQTSPPYVNDCKMSISRDSGATWSGPVTVGGQLTEDGQVTLAANGLNWVLAHSNINYGIEIYTSSNDAESFSLAHSLGDFNAPGRTPAAIPAGNGFLLTYDEFQKINPASIGRDWDIRSATLTGATFSAGAFVNADASSDIPLIQDQNVALDSSPAGTVIAVWEANDFSFFEPRNLNEIEVLFARSDDTGKTWSNSAPIDSNYAADTGGQFTPKVVYVGGTSWLVYWAMASGGYKYTRSVDDGRTWTAPEPLNSDATQVQIASNQNGILVLSAAKFGAEPVILRSLDGGASWTQEHSGGDAGLTAHSGGTNWMVAGNGSVTISVDNGDTWETVPSSPVNVAAMGDIDSDHNGTVIAVATVPVLGGTSRETLTWTASSSDNGRTWILSEITSFPDFVFGRLRASITSAGEGQWVAAWHVGSNSFAALSSDNGLTWGPAEQISVPMAEMPLNQFADVAAANGKVVVVMHTVPGDSIASPLGTDSDLVYSTANLRALPPTPLVEVKASIKLNFAKPDTDSIKLKAYLNIPEGFNPLGVPVTVNIGGIEQTFVMDAKGKASFGTDRLKLKVKSKKGVVAEQLAKVQVNLKKGNFATDLADEGLVNGDVEAPVTVTATIHYGDNAATAEIPLFYKSKADRNGKAR